MRRRYIKDKLFTAFALLSLILIMIPLIHIILVVVWNGYKAFSIEFFTSLPKPAGEVGGGVANAIEGTIVLVSLAMAISFPIGLFAGIYLAEYGKGTWSNVVRNLTDTLSGVPSIVMGLFSYTLLVIYYGFSAISGAFALALISLPYIIKTTEEAIKAVPNEIREAGLALGIPKWKVDIYIVLGAARPRILAGTLLAMSRIIGEAAPLLFTAFGSPHHFRSIFEPVDALPLLIFKYALSPYPDWHLKAWGAALLLMIVVMAINLIVKQTKSFKVSY